MIPSWGRSRPERPLAARALAATGSRPERLTWQEISEHPDYRGRWIALHACRFDEVTGKALDGELVDCDDDLAALCGRVRDTWNNCAILFVSAPQLAN